MNERNDMTTGRILPKVLRFALPPALIGARTAYLAEAVGWVLAAIYLIGVYIWKMRRLGKTV